MKKSDEVIRTEYYRYGKYLIQIRETKYMYHAYVEHDVYGLTLYMFGVYKDQGSYDDFLTEVNTLKNDYINNLMERLQS